MFLFSKLRLPYRDDAAFSLLAFAVFLVPLAFSLFSYENFESIKFSLFLIFTGASAAVFVFKQNSKNQVRQYHKYLYWLLGLFGVWAVIAAIFSGDRLYAVFGFYYRYTSGLVFYGVLGLFIWLLANLLNAERLRFLLKILVAGALLVSLVAFLQSFGWIFYAGLSIGGFFRGPSLLGNPNYSAMFLAVIFPLALYFWRQTPNFKAKVYYGLSAFFIAFACFLLASRGALLAMAASLVLALVLLLVFRFPKKIFFSLLILNLALGLVGYFSLNVSRPRAVSGVVAGADENTASRFYAWKVSLSGIARQPWLGEGPGNYALFFERSRTAEVPGETGVFDDAHNLFLQLAVTGGMPLVVLFAAIIITAGFYGLKQLAKSRDLLSLTLISGLAAWVVGVSFNPVPIPMFLALAVLLLGLLLNSFTQKQVSLSFFKKSLFMCFGLLIAFWGFGNLIAENLLGLARNAYGAQNYSQAYRLSAAAYYINPTNQSSIIYKTGSEIHLDMPGGKIKNDIQKVAGLHKSQASSYISAGTLYGLLYAGQKQKQDLQSAIQSIRQALNIDPWFSEWYGRLALLYYQAGDYQNAQIAAEKNLQLDNKSFPALILQARLYQLSGKRQEVIDDLNQAYKLRPDLNELKYLLYLAKNLSDIKQLPINIPSQQPEI